MPLDGLKNKNPILEIWIYRVFDFLFWISWGGLGPRQPDRQPSKLQNFKTSKILPNSNSNSNSKI
jgi:hypothetical protein